MRNGPTLALEDIVVGAVYSFEHTFTRNEERIFSELTQDSSAITMEGDSEPIVHGMLAASFFSTLVDSYCPGPNCLYVSQTLQFRKPLKYGDYVVVRATVLEKGESTRLITLKTEIVREGEIAISGEARVKVL